MATKVHFVNIVNAVAELFFNKLYAYKNENMDSARRFSGIDELDRKNPIQAVSYMYREAFDAKTINLNSSDFNDKVPKGFIFNDAFKNKILEFINGNGDIKIVKYKEPKEITDDLVIENSQDYFKSRITITFNDIDSINPDGKKVLYKLFVFCFMQFYAKFTFKKYSGTEEPWVGVLKDKKLIPVDGSTCYRLFRSDTRKPEDIKKTGFQPYIESVENLGVINNAIKELETALGGDEGKKIWFRYKQNDLCTETGIALSTNFNDVVVFPKNEDKSDAFFFTDRPSKPQPVFSLSSGATAHVVASNCYKSKGTEGYPLHVYIMKIEGSKINDTANQQGKPQDAWPELGMRSVSKEEIIAVVTVERWPIKTLEGSEGWFVIKEIENEGKLSVAAKMSIGKKNKLYTYKWTITGGEVAEVV
jgi:hypothetical protein